MREDISNFTQIDWFRFPFIASEIFNCELNKINNLFFELEEKNSEEKQNSEH